MSDDPIILPGAYYDGLNAASSLAHRGDENFDTGPMMEYAAALGPEYLADFERGFNEYGTPSARSV